MSSANLFADNHGAWIRFAMAAVCAFGTVGLLVLLMQRFKVKSYWIAMPAVLLGFVAGIIGSTFIPWPRAFGEYQALYSVRGPAGERLAVLTKFRARGKGSTDFYYVLALRGDDWRELSFVAMPTESRSSQSVAVRAMRGTYAWISSPSGYVVVDLAEPRIVGSEVAAATGLGVYKEEGGFDSTTLELPVLLQNGEKRRLIFAEPPPAQPGVAVVPLDVALFCTTRKTSTYWRSSPAPVAAKLLRPTVVHRANAPCGFSFGGEEGLLALHKSTAFGDGTTLLSALKKNGERRWTADLTARIGDDPNETLELLRAEVAQGKLSLLVGRKVTIYAMTLDAASGNLLSERALY